MVETKNQVTDSELVLKLAGFNSEAFEQLFSRYSSFLYGFIKKIIGDPKLSEQVLLNVFSIFWKRIDNYDATTNNVFTYLTLLTRNRAIDVLKRMDEHKLSPLYDDNFETERILPKLSPVMKPISLELALAYSERIRFYKSQLTEIQNLVLNLVFFEGLSDEEISKKLNVPEATVRQKIQTTLASLMQNLSGKNPDLQGNKKVLDLIKLEAIGRLSPDEKEFLTNQKIDDPDFPWALLGEYQNLVALLASVVVPENPSTDLSKEIKNLFSNVLVGKSDLYNVVIPYNITKKQTGEVKQADETAKNPVEEFPIRFKEPSKQDLEIIEEISQGIKTPATEPIKSNSEVPVEKEPVKIENKSIAKSVADNKVEEVKPISKPEIAESKVESKATIQVQNKATQQTKPELNKPFTDNVQTIDPDSINKKLNQLLSKTEEIKDKKKIIEEKTVKEEKPAEKKSDISKEEFKTAESKTTLQEVKTEPGKTEKIDIKDLNKVLDKAISKEPDHKEKTAKDDEIKKTVTPANTTRKEEKTFTPKSGNVSQAEDQKIEKLIEDYKQTYEKEIGALQKKLKRNILITAGLIILLLAGAAAIFLNMQKESPKLVTKVEKPVVETQHQNIPVETESNQVQQQNLQSQNTQPNNQQQKIEQPKDQQNLNQQKTEQPKKEEQKAVYPPLPEAPKILEPVINGEANKDSDETKKATDIAINKTEKTEPVAPQKEEKPLTEEPAFFVAVEEPPQPIGGLANIQKKIIYPEIAKRLGVEGKVLVQAIIDENGNVAKAKVIKGIGSGCDEVALDAVKSSKFTPGKQRGKNVRVQITIPIVFKL